MANTKVTQHVIANNAITADQLASAAVTDAKLHSTLDLSGKTLTLPATAIPSASTATTQAASDNSTKLATTAYVTTAIGNLVDSAPTALDTLNELAAALGDDANFSGTVTTSLASKLPLAGGTMTGALVLSGAPTSGLHAATKTYVDTADALKLNLTGGTLTGDLILNTTTALQIPVGTTGQRPTAATGQIRWNSTDGAIEVYNGTAWTAVGTGSTNKVLDTFTGDGSTTTFTLSVTPANEDAIMVFIDGAYQEKSDYVLTNNSLALGTAPLSGEKIAVHTTTASVHDGTSAVNNQFTATAGQTAFTLTQDPSSENNTQVYINGVYQQKTDYTVVGTTLTFDTGLTVGDVVEVNMFTVATLGNTDTVTEGVSNLYHTTARARGAISVSGNAISYNSSTGVITSAYEENPTFTGTVTSAGLAVDTTTLVVDSTNNRVGIGTTSPSQTLDVAGTALVENAKLKAIAASNSDTAVDVFVYDTRKDSDGGAWRKRTQHTSWYNETLNTSTRGARKEFPCVAVIVMEYASATGSSAMTIYDGDDPTLPMWMSCQVDANNRWIRYNGTIRSVAALNGIILAGANGGDVTDSLLSRMDLICDKLERHFDGGVHQIDSRGIVHRNSDFKITSNGTQNIINRYVNDVAMTVLPNAPIDADSGLPVPTIAVATAGGVSVIKDDGSVVDITSANGWNPSGFLTFDEDNYIVAHVGNATGQGLIFRYPVPSSDITVAGGDDSMLGGGNIYNQSFPHFGSDLGGMSMVTHDESGIAVNSKNNSYNQLVKYWKNDTDYSYSSVAYINSDYNTGWMNGDIKLATLSDTDTTNAVGSELISNSSSFSNTTGWYLDASNTSSGTIATLTVSGNNLVFTHSNTNEYWDGFGTSGTFVVGKTYTIDTTIVSATNMNVLRVSDSASQHDADIATTINSAGTHSFTFIATATTMYFHWNGYYTTSTITLSNFSVRLAEQDRSVNGKGLQVFGTVTKTAVATGAELVGYSGFSSSNYLRQPYNSDLNFGTGSYSVMGWFKTDATNSTGIIAQNGPSDADENLMVYISPSNYGIYFDYGAGGQYSYLSQANDRALISDTNWHHFVCHVSAGGAPKIYVDGVDKALTVIGNAPSTFAFDTDYLLNIGTGRGTDNNLPFGGSIALLRISATVPSPEQIKKIYDDEKHLFATNAKATLYGNSDSVTALAYDDDTELLHVGTSAGRSVFQGLNRVDNTTDAVGAAISASNEFIVEE